MKLVPITTCALACGLLLFIPTCLSQAPEGFHSINCGGDGFIDSNTGITWTGDANYLDSATELLRVGAAVPVTVNLTTDRRVIDSFRSNTENSEALKTAMMFLPMVANRSKYCYRLPVEENHTNWLLRAIFPCKKMSPTAEVVLNRSLSYKRIRFEFMFSVDATVITTVLLESDFAQIFELVVSADNSPLHVCLLPIEGSVCAISSLELRPLSKDMYRDGRDNSFKSPDGTFQHSPVTYLLTVSRINFGGDSLKPALRYPEDPYDRLWFADEFGRNSVNTTESSYVNEFPNFSYPPAVVESATEGYRIKVEIDLNRPLRDPSSFFISFCFLDVNPGDTTDAREVTVQFLERVERVRWEFVTRIHENRTLIWSNSGESLRTHRDLDGGGYLFQVKGKLETSLLAMINAFEMFEEIPAAYDRTPSDRVWLAKTFLSVFTERADIDVSGDPCLPIGFQWNVVQCDAFESSITLLNLSSRGFHGTLPSIFPVIPSDVYDRLAGDDNKFIRSLDLSNNSFHGTIPQSLLEFPGFGDGIYLDNNQISGFDFTSTINFSVYTLSLNKNSISTAEFIVLLKNFKGRLVELVLSENHLTGSLPKEIELLEHADTRFLDLSLNGLTGPLPMELFKLSSLDFVDLHGNQFSGSIPKEIKNLSRLYRIDLSDNKFSGTLPYELAELPDLQRLSIANNHLEGEIPTGIWNLSLNEVKLQNNVLTGTAPAEIWLNKSAYSYDYFKPGREVDLSYNKLTIVNLTTWCTKLSSADFAVNLSLVSNDITTIIHPRDCGQLFDTFDLRAPELFSYHYILLGGNTWCEHKLKEHRTRFERYLCRYNRTEDFRAPYFPPFSTLRDQIDKRLLIGIAVGGVSLVLVIACVLLLQVWKLYRRTKALQEITEALAKEDVRPPFFKYDELKKATNNFSEENALGQGAFGAVYKAVQDDGNIVAVKLLFPTEQNILDFLKEMVVITGIKHRNLLQLKGCCVRDQKRFLIYEYAENGNLAEALWGNHIQLSWSERLNICICVARGLAYLHEELQPKIIHRDIKPQNILLDRNWNAKIADFGLARPVLEDTTQVATTIGGTLGYCSPEYATMGVLSEKLDVYSYGIVVLEILSGRRCIDSSLSEEKVYLRTLAFSLNAKSRLEEIAHESILAEVPQDELLSVLKLALLCLQDDPSKRPTMSEVVTTLAGKWADLTSNLVGGEQTDYLRTLQRILNDNTTKTQLQENEEGALLTSLNSRSERG